MQTIIPSPYKESFLVTVCRIVSVNAWQVPFFLSTLPPLIMSFSWTFVGLSVVGLLCGVWLDILLRYTHALRKDFLVVKFLEKFRLNTFQEYPLVEYIPSLLNFGYSGLENMAVEQLKPKVRIFVISKGHGKAMQQWGVSYRTSAPLVSTSYIFIKDKPTHISGIRKFLLFHEIGHTDFRNASIMSIERTIRYSIGFYVLWVVVNIKFEFLSISLLTLFGFILFLLFRSWAKLANFYKNAFEEINADQFAFDYLDEDEKKYLVNFFERNPRFLSDSSDIDEMGIAYLRLKALQDRLANNLNRYNPRIPIPIKELFIASLFIPLFGFFFNKPSNEFLLINCFLCSFVPFFLVVVGSSTVKNGSKEIDSILTGTLNPEKAISNLVHEMERFKIINKKKIFRWFEKANKDKQF